MQEPLASGGVPKVETFSVVVHGLPVAVTLLVKNPTKSPLAPLIRGDEGGLDSPPLIRGDEGGLSCHIYYRDIGDYLTREEKLDALSEAKSTTGLSDWQTIIPDKYHDWIGQRNDEFSDFYALGSESTKAGKADDAIFGLYSRGYATGRDAYIYNFSRDACVDNAQQMTQDYINALSDLKTISELSIDEAALRHSSNLKWDFNLKENLKRKKETEFEDSYIRKVVYRPFIATNCYANYIFAQRKYQQDLIFPNSPSENRVICVPGLGSKKVFSALMTDTMPDLGFNEASQCFPRYRYPKPTDTPNATDTFEGIDAAPERIDNISDTALHAFREQYSDNTITKDAIFDYVYGILHAPRYREEFANDLSKMIPRIPFAPDFHAFAEAGASLATLHLNYETCEQYPLELILSHPGEPQPSHFRLTEKAMRFADKETRDTLILNEHVRLSDIPEAAHRYVVNGRTPLEWFMDRYKITTDRDSGIVNDPNGWFGDPCDLVAAIARVVYVSVESARIVEGLPGELTL